MESTLQQNLNQVRQQIQQASEAAGREAASVNLLAVSKTKPAGDILAAYQSGQRDFGENYLQEAVEKIEQLQFEDAQWHFIGAIQSNKTRVIADHFDWVHTVASEKVARRLSDQRAPEKARLNVLIQVNVDGEESKSGVAPEDLKPLIESCRQYPGIVLRGLMTIPKPEEDFERQRQPFRQLAELQREMANTFSLEHFDQLSMGMSSDLAAAIMEGATWVRIGTAIFGARAKP